MGSATQSATTLTASMMEETVHQLSHQHAKKRTQNVSANIWEIVFAMTSAAPKLVHGIGMIASLFPYRARRVLWNVEHLGSEMENVIQSVIPKDAHMTVVIVRSQRPVIQLAKKV